MTNADKIRNLSDEELVDLLAWGEVYAEGLKVPSCDEGCEVTMAKRRIGGYTTTREVYKTVKKYDHQQFDEFCTRIYANGFNDGKKSVTEKPVKTITDEQLMEVIGEVKGVGPALRGKIKEAIEAKFGSIGNGKKTEEQKGTAC